MRPTDRFAREPRRHPGIRYPQREAQRLCRHPVAVEERAGGVDIEIGRGVDFPRQGEAEIEGGEGALRERWRWFRSRLRVSSWTRRAILHPTYPVAHGLSPF